MWYTTKDTRWKKQAALAAYLGSSLLGLVVCLGYHYTAF